MAFIHHILVFVVVVVDDDFVFGSVLIFVVVAVTVGCWWAAFCWYYDCYCTLFTESNGKMSSPKEIARMCSNIYIKYFLFACSHSWCCCAAAVSAHVVFVVVWCRLPSICECGLLFDISRVKPWNIHTAFKTATRKSNFMCDEPINWQLLIFTQNNPTNVFYCHFSAWKRVRESKRQMQAWQWLCECVWTECDETVLHSIFLFLFFSFANVSTFHVAHCNLLVSPIVWNIIYIQYSSIRRISLRNGSENKSHNDLHNYNARRSLSLFFPYSKCQFIYAVNGQTPGPMPLTCNPTNTLWVVIYCLFVCWLAIEHCVSVHFFWFSFFPFGFI